MMNGQTAYMVTGAAGFIGSHLSARLLEEGCTVIGIDSFTDYYDPGIKRNNLRELRDDSNFRLLERDVLSLDMERWTSDIDGIFHQSAQAGVRSSWGQQFNEYVNSNIRATQYLLESLKIHAPELPFVMASSSSVYGIPDELPMREDMFTQPYSPYGVTKLASEHLAILYADNFDLNTACLRYFTVFGPRQRPDMAFTRFLTWGLNGEPISVYGDGSQTRDFTYVEDVVEANLQMMKAGPEGTVYNVGGGNRSSLNEVFTILEEILDQPLDLEHESEVKGDVPHTDADVDRIRTELGWNPEVSLRQGLSRQAEWVRERKDVQEEVLDR